MTLDFDKCICSEAGHCPLFNKKMELDPPNWQWCQSASAEDREKHYCDSQKSQTRSKMLSEIIGEKNNKHAEKNAQIIKEKVIEILNKQSINHIELSNFFKIHEKKCNYSRAYFTYILHYLLYDQYPGSIESKCFRRF